MTPEQILFFTVAVPIIVGLVQVAKSAGLDTQWAGPAALLLGTVFGVTSAATGVFVSPEVGMSIGVGAFQGFLAGLGATGAWSTSRSIGHSIASEKASQ